MGRSLDDVSSIGRRRIQARTDPGSGYRERRLALLKAAGTVFLRQGFQGTSMNDVAQAVGTDRATVYYYYGSKQELFLDVIRPGVEESVKMAEQVAATPDPARDRLHRLIELQLDAYERHYPSLHVFAQEDMRRIAADGSRVSKELLRLSQRYERALASITADGVSSGDFRADLDAKLITMAVVGAISWSHRWFKPGGRVTGASVGQAYAEIFVHGVTTPRPPTGTRRRRP